MMPNAAEGKNHWLGVSGVRRSYVFWLPACRKLVPRFESQALSPELQEFFCCATAMKKNEDVLHIIAHSRNKKKTFPCRPLKKGLEEGLE